MSRHVYEDSVRLPCQGEMLEHILEHCDRAQLPIWGALVQPERRLQWRGLAVFFKLRWEFFIFKSRRLLRSRLQ